MSATGVRKSRNDRDRITRALIKDEEQFIQSLKIFNNTSIVGAQGASSGGAPNASTTAPFDPIILNEKNLGTRGFLTQLIDWSTNNFYRVILNGNIGILMEKLPALGKWQQLIIEFTQDATGGHTVNYNDIFANGVVPLTNLLPGAKTTVVFYAYNIGTSVILAFETRSAGNTNFIHAIKAADQAAPLTVTSHAEFDTVINNSGIAVSTGAGQLSGIFSGFRAGRTYECECFIGMRDTIAASLGYCWVDIATGFFIGSRGFVGTLDNTGLFQSQQPSAKTIFKPTADTDTLEVQFTTNTDVTGIVMLGSLPAQPESYVVIKDIT